jgi:type IV pilus assembly protein PilO
MSKSFSVSPRLLAVAPRMNVPLNLKDPRVLVRAALGVLVVANIVAALLAFKPWGGSAEDLAREQVNLQQQLTSIEAHREKTKALVTKAERARQEGDGFLAEYTTDRRTIFSTIFAELDRVTREAGIQPRPSSYELDQVEGSDTLYQMTISAAYEGSYASLTKFVNLLDKSPRFLIIESLMAAPQQSNVGDLLSVSIKLDTFVREQLGNPI